MALSLNPEIDPFRQLQREVRLKQLRIDDLAQVNTYHSGIIKGQMKLIDKTRQEYKTLSLKYERVLKENDLLRAELLKERDCKRGIGVVMGSSKQEIPKHEVKLVAQKKVTTEELRAKIAIAFAKEQLMDDMRKWEVDLCPPQEHQVTEQRMTQSKQTTNLEVKVGPKQVETEKPVPVPEEPVVYDISDCILRKKCFDDEEIDEDEVDEDIEKLIIETYSKKVTFEEDVEETEFVEEELAAEDGELGAEEGDRVDKPQEVPTTPQEEEEEEEEFLSTDDEDEDVAEEQNEEVTIVGEIGQFRKKTFDDEEVIDEVDPEVELMIIRTYATFVSFDGEEE